MRQSTHYRYMRVESLSKDADFINSHLLTSVPDKLLVISTGNLTNHELEALFVPNIRAIVEAFRNCSFVELTRTTLIVHA